MNIRFLIAPIILYTAFSSCDKIFEGEADWKNNARLIQREVLPQFSTPGSSPASCGYHALRNALCSVGSKPEELRSQESMEATFDVWRQTIRNKRMSTHRNAVVFNTLMESFKGVGAFVKQSRAADLVDSATYKREGLSDVGNFNRFVTGKVTGILKTVCASTLVETHHDSYYYDLTSDKVYSEYATLIKTLIKDKTNCTCRKLFKALATRDQFDEFFKPINSQLIFISDGTIVKDGRIIQKLSATSDWVDNQELIELIDQEKACGMLKNKHTIVKTYGHSADNDLSELDELKSLIKTTKKGSAAIIIYTSGNATPPAGSLWSWIWGNAESTKTHSRLHQALTNGHWFTLCVEFQNNFRTYTVLDSLGNGNRLNDEIVHRVISYLEGTAQSKPKSSSLKPAVYTLGALATAAAAYYFGKLFFQKNNQQKP